MYKVLTYGRKKRADRSINERDIDFQRKIIYRLLADEFEIFLRILLRCPKIRCKLYRTLKKARQYL